MCKKHKRVWSCSNIKCATSASTSKLCVGTPEFDCLVVLESGGGNEVGARMTGCGEHHVYKQIKAPIER